MAIIKYCDECKENTSHTQLGWDGDWCEQCEQRERDESESESLKQFDALSLDEKLRYLFKGMRRAIERSN